MVEMQKVVKATNNKMEHINMMQIKQVQIIG